MNEVMAVLMAVAGLTMMIYALVVVYPPAAVFVSGALLVRTAGRVMQDEIE